MGMALPEVFAYLDYQVFLRDWFDARKREDPDYSYAAFASAGGCSKAALANVIGGARAPRASTLDAFARAMELSPRERNYLGLLVELASAPDLAHRRDAMEKILSTEQYRQLRLAESVEDADVFRYLEFWYIPAIREMAGVPGFQADPEWIVDKLTPTIRPAEAASALETLFDLGFLERGESGEVVQREIRFRTAPTAFQKAAVHFHREVIPSLMRTIDTRRYEEQHLLTATITLDASMVPEVKARLNALVDQLIALTDDAPVQDGKRVYQVGLQLLPLSRELD
jgi:uncharacterized protein (TIGR02147 family)